MIKLVYGGSGSGKSAFAEQLAVSCGAERNYYVGDEPDDGKHDPARLQLQPVGDESLKAYHRDGNAEKEFDDLGVAALQQQCAGNAARDHQRGEGEDH